MGYPDDFRSRAFADAVGERVRDWNAVEIEDARICQTAKLTLQLAASVLMKLPRCQNPSLPDVRDIVTDMRELIGRLERAEELINAAIESEDAL